jgi:glycerophosphoryl diester phosphodiesterase
MIKVWLTRLAFVVALFCLIVGFINASWAVDPPLGTLKLIAHRGVSQLFDHQGVGRDTCTATRIEPPIHDYLENTVRSIQTAGEVGADMVEIDVAPTADGKMAVFHDWTLDCRTDGHGDVRSATMAGLKTLDPGYGYTADGGKTFPLRGSQRGAIPSLDEVLAAFPTTPFMFNFKSNDPGEADLLATALKAHGRNPVDHGDGFYGGARPVERIHQLVPGAWAWSEEGAKACTKDYVLTGWTTVVPKSCRNGTLIVPLNRQWLFWGWPNRLLQRMSAIGARVIVVGPQGSRHGRGLSLPEQLGEVPSTFKGYIWVDDIWNLGPALRPNREMRTDAQQTASEAALEKRRAQGD